MDVSPMAAPTLYAYQQAREDIERWTEELSAEQVWRGFGDIAPVGFQLRHIAGSVDRLTTYLRGEALSQGQLGALKEEQTPGAPRDVLVGEAIDALDKSEAVIRALPVDTFGDRRTVGRQALPTTVMGLLVHLAEHTQRHVGQLITTAKLARRS